MSGTVTVTNGEPTVTTGVATPVTETTATLKGTVNPSGKEATSYYFKYGDHRAMGRKRSHATPLAEGTTRKPCPHQ